MQQYIGQIEQYIEWQQIDRYEHTAHLCQISDLCTQFTLNSVDGGLELVQLSV